MLKRIISMVLCLGLFACMFTAIAATKTITMEEAWRLTSEMDFSTNEDVVLDGGGKYNVYEMDSDAVLKNTGSGKVTLKDTHVFPYGNIEAGTLSELSEQLQAYVAGESLKSGYSGTYSDGVSVVTHTSTGNKASDSLTTPYTQTPTPDGPSSVGGGGGSSGGGGGGGVWTTPTPTPTPTVTADTVKVEVKSTVTTTTSSTGAVVTTAKVESTAVIAALAAAVTQAEKSNKTDKIDVVVKVETSANATQAVLDVPKAAIEAIANTEGASLTANSGLATITLDNKALTTALSAGAGDNISVSVAKVDVKTLDAKTQEKIGDKPVFDFSIKNGDTVVSDFKGGTAIISMPYTPTANELKNPGAILIYYLSADGKIKSVPGKYNAATGRIDFETGHFSKYFIAFNLVEYPDTPSWAKDAVTFIAAREIVTYTGRLEPDKHVTRGEFLIALMKAYAVDISAPKDKYAFADITKGTELYNYAVVARELGITKGVDESENLFGTDNVITRQEIVVFFIKALESMNKMPKTDTGRTLSNYTDAAKVDAWATSNIEKAIKFGLIVSTSNDALVVDPKLKANRATMAQLMYNVLK